MVEFDDSTKKKLIFFGIGGLIVVVVVYNILRYGAGGISLVINGVISMSIWVLFIGAIFLLLYFFFIYEKKINAPLEVFKDIRAECKVSRPDNLRYLWTSGDSDHREKFIGRIVGYSHRQNYTKEDDCYKYEDIFFVSRSFKGFFGFFREFLSRPIPIRCPPDLHDVLHQDVKLKCVSLVKIGMYYYPDAISNDFDFIDKTQHHESMRYIQIKIKEAFAPIINKAMGIRDKDIKALEGKTGIEIVKEAGNRTK